MSLAASSATRVFAVAAFCDAEARAAALWISLAGTIKHLAVESNAAIHVRASFRITAVAFQELASRFSFLAR